MMAIEFPLIAGNTGIISSNMKQLFQAVCNVRIEEESAYLDEAEKFIERECMNTIRRIHYKRQSIINTEKFDVSKVSNLPDDCVYEISTYLQPEIDYTKKFILLRDVLEKFSNTWEWEYNLLRKVPKKLMMKLIDECGIYPSINNIRVRPKHQKSRWCNMILEMMGNTAHYTYSETRLDKILAVSSNHRYETYNGKQHIDNWYNFMLHIAVYNKYRRELEQSISGHSQLLANLKNNKIKVKK